MPPGGQTTDSSLVAKWYKSVGDRVERGDVLFSIETDKTVLEVESYCEGILRKIVVNEGDWASTGDAIALIGEADEPLPESNSISKDIEIENDYQPILPKRENIEEDCSIPIPTTGKMLVSPKARKLALQNNISLNDISATEFGIIKYQNVLNEVSNKKNAMVAKSSKIPISPMRKAIARRMSESVKTIPCFTISVIVQAEKLIQLRKTLNHSLNGKTKITFNDILAKFIGRACEDYPLINASYGDDAITLYKSVNIGIAVALEHGLVVPVIRDVQQKGFEEISKENSTNVDKARNGTLSEFDVSGGTITLSNLGMYGIDRFDAIINPPESCILAIGAIKEQAISIDQQILSVNCMNITASFDHRTIDGAIGAGFLKKLKTLIETPDLLML